MRVTARAALAVLALLAGALARAAAPALVEPVAPLVQDAPEPAPVAPNCPPPAATPNPDNLRAGMRDAVDSGLLWKASKDGRDVYLYGTIHVARMSWMFPGPRVMRAVLASDAIALELDPADPDIAQRLRKAILRTPQSPTLPEPLQRRLAAQMAAACVPPQAFAPMRAEMQAVSVEVLAGREFGLYPDYGIDLFLSGLAHGIGKPVRSLETPESQAELLVSDDPAETARSVRELLDALEDGRGIRVLRRLAGDWQRGDLDDLGAYATWCGCLDTARDRADFAKLVDDRNPLMADKIVKWHAQGQALFVAVGSLHMVGPVGLPALLKARGFQVERVEF